METSVRSAWASVVPGSACLPLVKSVCEWELVRWVLGLGSWAPPPPAVAGVDEEEFIASLAPSGFAFSLGGDITERLSTGPASVEAMVRSGSPELGSMLADVEKGGRLGTLRDFMAVWIPRLGIEDVVRPQLTAYQVNARIIN